MSNLRSTIEELATQFAGSIIEALRGASIDELLAVAQGGGTTARRGRPRSSGGGSDAGGSSAASTSGGNAGGGAARRGRRGGRLGRRTADDIARMVEDIATLLGKSTQGLRAEQIREALGVEAKELPRPLAEALASGRITKTGQKRATTYFVGSGDGGSSAGGGRRGGGRGGRGAGGGKKKRGG